MPIPSPNSGAWIPADDRERCVFLPLAVDVKDRLCVVIGRGRVATRKVRRLQQHGARVRLVVPECEPIAHHDSTLVNVEVVRHQCQAHDLAGARLVIAATNDPAENHRVACLARDMGILVLQVESPEDSDFHVPAILSVGDLTVSFATNGASPGFAVQLRDEAAAFYGPAHAEFCRLARWLRREAMVSLPSEARERLFQQLVDSDAVRLLSRGNHAAAAARARQLLQDARETDAEENSAPRCETAEHTGHAATVGRVFLVGAGPGDPELLTVKGARCLSMADTILYDGMVSNQLLQACPSGSQRVNVSKRKGKCERTQDEIIATLIQEARLGRIVVRLKGGDPLVFGRGGEEARALRRAGVPFEIVPGVSSVTAVPAYAGIPVTDRDYSASFAAYSAHRKGGLCFSDAEWKRIAQGPDTLIFLMGKTRCDLVARKLMEFGRADTTPVALIFNGTTPAQRTVVGTLGSIVSLTRGMDVPGPGLIVVGDVVNARPAMKWFEEVGAQEVLDRSETCPVE